MLYRQLSRLPVIPVLVALALAVAVALPVSADSDEVAGTMVSGGAAQVQAVPAPALASAARTQRYCDPSPSCPLISRTSSGWEIDTGGPGVYFERFAEDGD